LFGEDPVRAFSFLRQPLPETLNMQIADFAGGVARAKTTDIKTKTHQRPRHLKLLFFYKGIFVGPRKNPSL
jgi:hypothetical protein